MIKFQTKSYFINNSNLIDYGQISFYLGTFFLASALPISCIFFLISIFFSLINRNYNFFKCNWNKIILIISVVQILISLKFYFTNQQFEFNQFDKSNSLLGLFNWIPLFLIFILFQKYLEDEKKREIFSKFLVAGLIPLLFSCILQFYFESYGPWEILGGLIVWFNKPLTGIDGVSGLFSNQNYTGFWLSVSLPFLVPLINKYKFFNFKKISLIIISLISIHFLFLTNSRNAILGFILSTIIIFGIKKFIIILLCIIALISALNYLSIILPKFNLGIGKFFLQEGLLNKINQNNFLNLMDLIRVKIWTNSIKFIIQRPLLGFGASTFPLVYLSFQKSHSFSAQHAHNMPLQLAFEYGIPVSILLTSFISYLCFRAYCEVFKKGNKISLLNKCWFASSSVAVSSHILDITYYDGKISILIWILLSGLKCIIGNKSYKEIL